MVINAIIPLAAIGTQLQIQGMINRIYELIISVSAIVIAILWIPIGIGFFSSDESKKLEAKSRFKNAVIGTFIYVLAVSGALYAIFTFIVTGS